MQIVLDWDFSFSGGLGLFFCISLILYVAFLCRAKLSITTKIRRAVSLLLVLLLAAGPKLVFVTPQISGETENARSIEPNISSEFVADEQIKVLLVDQSPRFEYRFLREMLRREPNVELKTLLLDADQSFVEQDPFAISLEKIYSLSNFNAIVFGDVDPSRIGDEFLRNINESVKNFGTILVCVAGERFMPQKYAGTILSEMLPITFLTESNVAVSETDGFDVSWHSQFQTEEKAGVYWINVPQQIRKGARLIASGDEKPLICERKYGKGSVVWHGTDETWRWTQNGLFRDYWLWTLHKPNVAFVQEASPQRESIEKRAEAIEIGFPPRFFAFAALLLLFCLIWKEQ